jgi:uncharacterized protein (TIGR00106 family)
MKVIADLCVIPMGVGLSVSKEIAMCERILAAAGLKTRLHAYGTNIEGDWDRVFAAVKSAMKPYMPRACRGFPAV